MANIKEQIDQIYQALYGEEVRNAIIKAITTINDEVVTIDEKFISKIDEQNTALEKAQQIINKKILYLRISVVALFILLIANTCNQIVVIKSINAYIQEYNLTLEQNNQILRQSNQRNKEILSTLQEIQKFETVEVPQIGTQEEVENE